MIEARVLFQDVATFVTQLEGPYKWYVMAAVAFILTAFLTRFIFKTFKWILLLLFIGGLMVGGFALLIYMARLS